MSILTTVKPVRYPGRRCARPPRADLPAAPGLALTTRRGAKVLQPPPEPPKICRQTAITIAPDIGARYRQDLPYGSPAWHKTYATLRNTIEGLNGYAKDPAHEALAQPARRRVRGIAAQSIFTALLLMAANIRKIRAWRALTAPGKAASPSGHGGAAQASATTTQTANSAQPPASPPAGPTQARQARPRSGLNAASRPSAPSNPDHTAINATVRPPHHTQKQATARVLSV